MAVPVIETSATSTTNVVTKPTGLTVGDWLIAYAAISAGGSRDISPPAGWTTIGEVNVTSSISPFTAFYKVADSGDVAASDFTFTPSGSYDFMVLAMLRVSGVAAFGSSSSDSYSANNTTLSFTHSLTPEFTDSLLILANTYRVGNSSATVSSYGSTPSKTWSEVVDFNLELGATDPGMAIASATANSLTEVTATSATLSANKEVKGSWLISLTPPQDATGSNAVYQTTPVFFATTTGSTQGATNALFEIGANFPDESAKSTSLPGWTNPDKSSSSWTNQAKS